MEAIMAKRVIVITMGDQTIHISQLPIRKNEAWRRRVFESEFKSLFRQFQKMQDLGDKEGAAFEVVLDLATQIFQKGPDILIDLLTGYCPELSKEYLENECYDQELIDAFVAVLRLAFPLESLMEIFKKISIGPQTPKILKNWPSANGGSQTKIQPISPISANIPLVTSDDINS